MGDEKNTDLHLLEKNSITKYFLSSVNTRWVHRYLQKLMYSLTLPPTFKGKEVGYQK